MACVINSYSVAPSGVSQIAMLGNAYSSAANNSASSAAARFISVTPSISVSVSELVLMGYTATGQNVKALLYSDSGGAMNTLIAVGNATALGTFTTTATPISLPFSSPQTLSAGVTYWIGWIADGSFNWVETNGLGSSALTATVTYASPEASLAGGSSASGASPMLYARSTYTAALSGTDLVATSVYNPSSALKSFIEIPTFAVGDVAMLHVLWVAGTGNGAVTPSGWTLISNQPVNNQSTAGRNFVFGRILDGTETGVVTLDIGTTTNNSSARLTVFRGMNVSGTPWEGVANSFGQTTNVTSPAITTLGNNRLALNFFGAGGGASPANLTAAADSWTDIYDNETTLGNDSAISLTYLDAPTAGAQSTETRTDGVTARYAVCGLALIRA